MNNTLSSVNPKRELFEQFATVAKALGSGHRLELLEMLAQGERSVETLADLAGIAIANTSQHLQNLRRAGLATARRDGKRIFYRLADDAVVSLLGSLRQIAERNLAEVEKVVAGYFRERDRFEAVSRDQLLSRIRRRLVTVIDVRPPEEFAAGHIRGAINLPLKMLADELKQIPTTKEVVAYCRGPYCVLSYEAVALLRRRGFTARRLQDGYPEWKIAGLPIELGFTES